MIEARYQPKVEPFSTWLLRQKDCGEWYAALAVAARGDRGFPKGATLEQVRNRLQALGADADSFEQLDDAERAWRRETGGDRDEGAGDLDGLCY